MFNIKPGYQSQSNFNFALQNGSLLNTKGVGGTSIGLLPSQTQLTLKTTTKSTK
jgi:hypothetical protein